MSNTCINRNCVHMSSEHHFWNVDQTDPTCKMWVATCKYCIAA